MNCIKDMFPFVSVPFTSNTSISDFFSGCLTCQPFVKFKRRSVDGVGKSSHEIKTISTLVDKFTIHHDAAPRQSNTTPCYYNRATANFHRPCSRSTSFNLDMNHEKFTPCERQRVNQNDWPQSPANLSSRSQYGKIKNIHRNSPNWKCAEKIPENPIVAPPRRKKRPAPRIGLDFREDSQESSLELETWKNCRNLQLNNLDQPERGFPKQKNDEGNNNDNIRCKKGSINNSSDCTSLSYVTNNNLIKNNKSGCSKLAVVSDSLETNNAMQNFRKFDRLSDTSNNNNDKTIIIDNMEAGYCENKIYYKNSSFDKFGNYKHGNDADEVIICESYTKDEPKSSIPPHSDKKTPEMVDRPKNSTYTQFYTDKLYQDNFEMMSTKSLDEPFEQIVQLQPEMAPFLQSALAMLRAKTAAATTTSSSKHHERTSNSPERGHVFQRGSTEEDEITDSDNSIPVVFCGLSPIQQLNSSKWKPSIRVVGTTTPDHMLSSDEKVTQCATSHTSNSRHSNPAEHDNKLAFEDNIKDVDPKVVECIPKKTFLTVRTVWETELCPDDDTLPFSHERKIHADECRYAAADHCEL